LAPKVVSSMQCGRSGAGEVKTLWAFVLSQHATRLVRRCCRSVPLSATLGVRPGPTRYNRRRF
jgi:hypothetical protein